MRFELQKEANTIWFYYKHHIRSLMFQYCPKWDNPIYSINTNGARKGVKEDSCYDLNIHFWHFKFSYTNWNYNYKLRNQ